MKLKTSFFNPAVFRKDITRFAPSWGLYTLFLLLCATSLFSNWSSYYAAEDIAQVIGPTSILAMLYALLNAQLLFGDLYNSRLCNALHAMPLRRECWFVTHVLAGLAFCLVPNALVSLVAMPLLRAGWSVAAWWFLASTLEYVFFFGAAVCSALCVGSRLGQVLVYGLVNALSPLAYWFAHSLFEPLLYGVQIPDTPFLTGCPVAKMCMLNNLVSVDPFVLENDGYGEPVIFGVSTGPGWGYLALCAGIGIALLLAALLLYRRRNMECAGDFISVRSLKPVFLVLYSLMAGVLFQIFFSLFWDLGQGSEYLLLALGISVGFFTGRMLLSRTARVFQPKAFLGLGILAAVLALSLLLTSLDVLGITRRIPAPSDVESVTIMSLRSRPADPLMLTGQEDIQNILDVHRDALENCQGEVKTEIEISYTLKNGTELTRYYPVLGNSRYFPTLRHYFSSVEYVLGVPEDGLEELASRINNIFLYNYPATGDTTKDYYTLDLDFPMISGLLEAIAADCAAETMAQDWGFREDDSMDCILEWHVTMPSGVLQYRQIRIGSDCVHTLRFLEEHLDEFQVVS